MNKLNRLYKKALQGAKDRHSRELLAQGVEYMGVWSDAMTYCYTNGIEVPEDREGGVLVWHVVTESGPIAFLSGILTMITTAYL